MKNIILTITALFIAINNLSAQEYEPIRFEAKPVHDKDISKLKPEQILEDSLVYYSDSMYYSTFPENKTDGCFQFIKTLKRFLQLPNSYQYNLPKLKDVIQIVNAPDNQFRIFNWEINKSEAERRYYAVVQLKNGNYIPLIDVSDQIIRGAEDSVFSNNRWYGALYYNIVAQKMGDQNIYFLLGWNGASLNSEKKIVECFGFNSQGKAIFGAPLFNMIDRGKRKTNTRCIIEYQKGAKLSLNFDADMGMIIFDHCESQIGDVNKKYTYIPDGTYDGLRWDGRQWNMQNDVIQISIREQGNAPVEKPIK